MPKEAPIPLARTSARGVIADLGLHRHHTSGRAPTRPTVTYRRVGDGPGGCGAPQGRNSFQDGATGASLTSRRNGAEVARPRRPRRLLQSSAARSARAVVIWSRYGRVLHSNDESSVAAFGTRTPPRMGPAVRGAVTGRSTHCTSPVPGRSRMFNCLRSDQTEIGERFDTPCDGAIRGAPLGLSTDERRKDVRVMYLVGKIGEGAVVR